MVLLLPEFARLDSGRHIDACSSIGVVLLLVAGAANSRPSSARAAVRRPIISSMYVLALRLMH